MAKLPTADSLGGRAVPQPAAGISQYQVNTGEDDIGKAAIAAGSHLEVAADEIERRAKVAAHQAKIEQDRVDTLRSEQAFNTLRQKQVDLTAGDQGYERVRGTDAVARATPLYDDYTKLFDDAAKTTADGLTNDEQRQKFNARVGVAKLQFSEGLLRHVARESDRYGEEVYKGTMGTEIQNAQVNWRDPQAVALSQTRMDAAINNRASDLGWPSEYTQAVRNQEMGKLHGTIISQAISSGQPAYAEKWFNDHRDEIDLPTARVLEKAVEDGQQKQLTNDYTANFLGARDNLQALDTLHKKIISDPILNDDRKNMLAGRIMARADTIERKLLAGQQKQERQVGSAIDGVNRNTLAGYEATPEQMAPLMDAAKGNPELEARAKQMINLANTTRVFRQSAPLVQDQMLADIETQARKDPTRVDVNTINALRSIRDSNKVQLRENPIGQAVSQGDVDPKPIDLSNPLAPGTPEAMQGRLADARHLRDTKGAAFKPLTPEETHLVSDGLKRATADQKSAYFGGLKQAVGGDYEGYAAIMSQIAPDDPVTAMAGAYSGLNRNLASGLMLKGQEILNPPRKEDGTPLNHKIWPLPKDTDFEKQWQSYEDRAFAGSPQTRSAMLQGAKAIYAARTAAAGDTSGILDTDRWNEAMNLSTGGIAKYNGKSILMPYGYAKDEFKDALRIRVDSIMTQSNAYRSEDPASFGSNFETYLRPEEEKAFQQWKKQNAPNDSGQDYDLRGAFQAGAKRNPDNGHFSDAFKKPNHPTFSDLSIYAPYGTPGHWEGEKFIPPAAGAKPMRAPPHDMQRLDAGLTRSDLMDMPLAPIADGRYVFQAGDGILVDLRNRPIIVDFNLDRGPGIPQMPPSVSSQPKNKAQTVLETQP